MSKYTTEVRYICEVSSGLKQSVGFDDVNKILENSVDKIFDFDYPIFDEEYRRPLNIKILRNFYTREICEETVGLWKLRMQQTLCEIMPYYNQLYKSELEVINPLYNIDLNTTRTIRDNTDKNSTGNSTINTTGTDRNTENKSGTLHRTGTDKDDITNTIKKTGSETGSNTKTFTGSDKEKDVLTGKHNEKHLGSDAHTTNTSANDTTNQYGNQHNKDRYSDTPQGTISNLEDNLYMTNARLIDQNNNSTTTDNATGKETYKGSDNYTDNGTNSETKNKTATTSETTKQSETNKTTENETGKKTGTKTINEQANDSYNKTSTGSNEERRTGNSQEQTEINSLTSYFEHVVGYKGSKTFGEILVDWRNSFINIDKMILDDLESCFFQLW